MKTSSASGFYVSARLALLVRVALAAVWLYEGLFLKILWVAPHELSVVESVNPFPFLTARGFMAVIGAGETLLAVGVLSGLFPRFIAWFQGLLIVSMNTIGILFGDGAISDPVDLIVRNLPFLACIILSGSLEREGSGA